MNNLQAFRKRVQELCRRSSPYDDGRHATQRNLAEAIGLHPTELSKRLNGARDARLSDRDVRAIVLALAEWDAIQSQAEALDLLALGGGASFTAAEWQSSPLDLLTPLKSQATAAPPRLGLNNLPRALTSFVGRRQEIAEVEQLLTQTRLLTLTGAGGCGKTRLALEVAARRVASFHNEVWLVELAALSDPQLVPQAVAATLKLREQPGTPLLDTLAASLHDRDLLLVLDNCEHLMQAVAALVHQLLLCCPRLRILTTSREPLRTEGEVVWRLPSMSLPPAEAKIALRSLAQYEAIRLFMERAKATLPGMALTQSNAASVREVCTRLDGIPLALELAAAMVRVMSVAQICAHLDDRFALLTTSNRTALPRQQTLKALIDWSYDLLTAEEQRLLARLAVFAGGFSLEAAEGVCTDPHIKTSGMVIGLGRLVDKSLVLKEEQEDSTRYRLLETIRQYAAEKLAANGEEEVRRRHAEHYLALAEQAEPELRGTQQVIWLNRLEREHDNLRGALGWTLGGGEIEMGMRLGGTLWKFWETHGHISEGRRWLTMALARRDGAAPLTLARVLNGAGILAWNQSDHPAARSLLEESLKIYRELGDNRMVARLLSSIAIVVEDTGDYSTAHTLLDESLSIYRETEDEVGIALALNNFGNVLMYQGEYDEAYAVFAEALSLYRQLGEARGIAISLHNLAIIVTTRGELKLARTLREESLAIFRRLGDERNTAYVLESLGGIAIQEEDYEEAYTLFEQSLTILQKIGDEWASAILFNNLGNVAVKRGNYAEARAYYKEGIKVQSKIGNKKWISESLEGFASLAVGEGQMKRAAQLLGISESLRETTGTPLTPAERAVYEHNIAAARAELGTVAFAAAWLEGRAMSLEQAVEYALAENG